jgi:hypothetical protein
MPVGAERSDGMAAVLNAGLMSSGLGDDRGVSSGRRFLASLEKNTLPRSHVGTFMSRICVVLLTSKTPSLAAPRSPRS